MQKEHLEVILESIYKKFDIVIEGYNTLDKKIDDMAQKTDERFDLVYFKFDVLNWKIDGVAADLKATDERLNNKIDSVEQRLSMKIDGVAADLKATDERLIKKIDSVESNLTRHINAVAADLKAHRADTEAHGGIYQVKEK